MTVLCNIVKEVTSHQLCLILLFRNKSQVPPTLREMGLITQEHEVSESGINWGHLRVCPSSLVSEIIISLLQRRTAF